MGLLLALRAFGKAIKNPEKAKIFLEESKAISSKQQKDRSHLRLLSFLQKNGRFIDFLHEEIEGFSDAQIGAAVRQIHEGCKKTIEEHVTVRPIMEEKEGTIVSVPEGYAANEIKLVGRVKGSPPFEGTLVHKGWKAHKHSLSNQSTDENRTDVIAPAEIEIK